MLLFRQYPYIHIHYTRTQCMVITRAIYIFTRISNGILLKPFPPIRGDSGVVRMMCQGVLVAKKSNFY